jgi:hypothetical protein
VQQKAGYHYGRRSTVLTDADRLRFACGVEIWGCHRTATEAVCAEGDILPVVVTTEHVGPGAPFITVQSCNIII